MFKPVCFKTLSALLLGCTNPNVTPEIDALTSSAETVTERLSADLEPRAEKERDDLLQVAIQNRDIVVLVSPGCTRYQNRVEGATLDDCQLQDVVAPDQTIQTAERALVQVGYLNNYISALAALAKSDAPNEISASTVQVIAAIDALSNTDPGKGLADFAADLKDQQPDLETAVGYLATQYKFRSIRRTVLSANNAVGTICDALIAFYDDKISTQERTAFTALETAEAEMRSQRTNVSPEQYGVLVQNVRDAHAAYVEVAKKGPVQLLVGLRTAHAALADRLARPRDAEEVIEYLDELREFVDAVEAL